jgi:catechol 2,3-dioxygenase-like lactoylglutathione lyase family enzyme
MSDSHSPMPRIRDFRPLIICNEDNFAATRSFYSDLGFRKLWDDGKAACEFATGFGEQRFMVTLHHGVESTGHGIFQFWVEDAQTWYDYMAGLELEERYPGVTVSAPGVMPWGWLIAFVTDPSGLLLHFAEPHSEANKTFFNSAPWMM